MKKYIIFAVILFLFYPIQVLAAESKCTYKTYSDSLAGTQGGTLNCNISYTEPSGPLGIMGGLSYSCKYKQGDKNNTAIIINDNKPLKNTNFVLKDYYSKQKKCPPYMVINTQNPSGYNFYAANTEDEAMNIIHNTDIEGVLGYYKESSLEADESLCKNMEKHLEEQNGILKAQHQQLLNMECDKFKLSDEERNVVASAEHLKQARECTETTFANKTLANNAQSELDRYVEKGCLKKSDSLYTQYQNSYAEYGTAATKMDDDINEQLRKPEKTSDFDKMPASSVDPSVNEALKNGCEIIQTGTATFEFLKKVINYVKIGTIFLVLVLGMVDLAGAVGSEEENAFKKAGTKFGKRLIAVALVFLVPAIVEILISLVNDASCEGYDPYENLKDLYD